ncbi:MAG: YdcF family protein [Pseudobdellovibrio sp.]
MAAILFLGLFLNERSLILQAQSKKTIDGLAVSDCGVVLTGSAGRIREAFEVLALGKVKKLIISGVYKDTKLHEIFPHLPYYPEIKTENIILEKISGSTRENAVQSLLLVEKMKCSDILLITSELHMYRAERTFKANFPTSIPIHTFAIASPPKEDRFYDEVVETFKSLFYSLLRLAAFV